jgi:hypothetical protein
MDRDERYKKIALAIYLIEELFCKMSCVTVIDHELDFKDLFNLRHALIRRIMGNYRFDLIDLSEDGLDQLIALIKSEINRCK